MIFYFTGTGNSLYATQFLAEAYNDQVISIADAVKREQITFTVTEGESVGFVFPIYYWGLPTIVRDFVDRLVLKNYSNNFTYAVITCGSNIGDAMQVLQKKLQNNSYHLDSGFSIIMPDNYILMYDVLSKDAQEKKLKEADNKLQLIRKYITAREKEIFLIEKGPFPKLLTYGVHALYKHGRKTKKFHVTDSCTGCGLCEKICAAGTIHMDNGKPVWDKECIQCLACINRCPKTAIQYGKSTYKRGRYVNPRVKF